MNARMPLALRHARCCVPCARTGDTPTANAVVIDPQRRPSCEHATGGRLVVAESNHDVVQMHAL